MGTASFTFLAFSLIVILIFNVSGRVAWRQATLLAASLAFLSFFSHDWRAWVPFGAFLAFGYASLRLIARGAVRSVFVLLIIACITAFIWLKKYSFVPAALWLQHPYVTLGLSYILFRLLHLLIDLHSGQIEGRVSLVSYLNYLLNFTTLLSGPIQTYQDFASRQLSSPPLRLDVWDQGAAVERIIVGFFKVNVLSLVLSMIRTQALTDLPSTAGFASGVGAGILIVGLYPLYLYCNFSGYIDLVIGIARFLRMELPENFNRPFFAGNFMIFWSRWHITLSNWLKSYVYNPLLIGSMRRFDNPAAAPYLGIFAIFVTFFLVGLWHGQTSEFLFFGVLQGGGVAGVQLYQLMMTRRFGKKSYRALTANPLYGACSRGLTFTWFAFTLLWFWSTWGQIGGLAQSLSAPGAAAVLGSLFAAATLVLAAWEAMRNLRAPGRLFASRYARVVVCTTVAVICAATVALVNAPAPDLIYKAF